MEQLGIEPTLLLAQIVNFLIILFVLSKLLYKPVLAMLEKRKKEIAEGLALTEKMRQEEEKTQVKREKVLEEARREARNIVDAAKKEAEAEHKEIVATAHKEATAVLEKGKEDVAGLRAKMEHDVQSAAVELAMAMSKKLLGNVLTGVDHHKLLAKHMKELEHIQA